MEALVSVYHDKAIAEGVILRPVHEAYALNNTTPRRILKKKRALFLERKPATAVSHDRDATDKACEHVTAGRLLSVRSKLRQDVPFYDVAKALAADAIDEIEKRAAADADDEDYTFWSRATGALKKRMRKSVTDAAFELVKGQGI